MESHELAADGTLGASEDRDSPHLAEFFVSSADNPAETIPAKLDTEDWLKRLSPRRRKVARILIKNAPSDIYWLHRQVRCKLGLSYTQVKYDITLLRTWERPEFLFSTD